jgi:hyperosmotically inducible periplasmic protein
MKLQMKTLGLALGLAMSTALVSLCGCAGNRYEQSTGEHIDDKSTSMRVKKALHEDGQYKYNDVEVATFKGTTQLSGFVNTRDQKSRAGEIAKTVEGVKALENNISVKE